MRALSRLPMRRARHMPDGAIDSGYGAQAQRGAGKRCHGLRCIYAAAMVLYT